MNNATTLIMEDLSHLKGKSADHITRFLKRCGGGEDSTMVDEHFKSTPTYTRLNDHIIGQLFRLEDSDIAKYLNSVIIATTEITNAYLEKYYVQCNATVANYYFNNTEINFEELSKTN